MENLKIQELQLFMARLNSQPSTEELEATPDGKAKTLPISFIEMTLDEIFLGMWSTKNFTSKQVANEVIGELELEVINPVTWQTITRTGAAAIQITVDKAPEDLKGAEKNRYALNIDNKKPNALDLTYPKLKAECTKNAAQTLGKIFGRDLNRKKVDAKFKSDYLNQMPESMKLKAIDIAKNEGRDATAAMGLYYLIPDDLKAEITNIIDTKKQLTA